MATVCNLVITVPLSVSLVLVLEAMARGSAFVTLCSSSCSDERIDDDDDIDEKDELISPLPSPRPILLAKQYSYEELRRKSVKLSSDDKKSERLSVGRQFSEEVRSVFHQREDLLNDKEFSQIFQMSKTEFKDLPKWRQQELKKRYNLF